MSDIRPDLGAPSQARLDQSAEVGTAVTVDSAAAISTRPNCPNLSLGFFQGKNIQKGERGGVGRVGTESDSVSEVGSTTIGSVVPTPLVGRRDEDGPRSGQALGWDGASTPQRPTKLTYQRRRRAKARLAGKCTTCAIRKARPGRVQCEQCATRARRRPSRNRPARGLCHTCALPCLPGMSQCLTHKLANQDRTDALRAAKAAAGVCRDCRCDAVPGRKQCETHLEAGRQRWLRRAVLPVAAPGSQGRGELSRIGKSKDNAS